MIAKGVQLCRIGELGDPLCTDVESLEGGRSLGIRAQASGFSAQRTKSDSLCILENRDNVGPMYSRSKKIDFFCFIRFSSIYMYNNDIGKRFMK
jgi:hypothetical protein